MRGDWRKLVRRGDSDIRVDALRSFVVVEFKNGRSHRVNVDAIDDGYGLEAVIAGPAETARLHDPYIAAWQRNRSSRVVGYRIDGRGRLIAHAWSPRHGLSAEMFLLLVRTLAREADRHELLITGLDRR
jgi:hypothetical protein